MKKEFLLLLCYLILGGIAAFAQDRALTQTVRGEVLDVDSKMTLPGAGVKIFMGDSSAITLTDYDGHFKFSNVPVGRHSIEISFVGFEKRILPNVLVNAGKETYMTVELHEQIVEMKEAVIKVKNKGEAKNENAVVSAREFSVEETKRYPASFNDPARMASAFAGVASDPSGNNDIVIRGNSPKGVLWRIEGVESPNPNHFANDGATGGPISILNSNIIGNSDFFTSAFPAEYGNAYSGVFDINLRKGNQEKQQYAFQLSTMGLDASAEGPINKESRSSYIANYRYSTLSLLDAAGIVDFDGVPKYQDAAFKVHMPTDNFGTFTVFGVGGLSNIDFSYANENGDTTFSKGNYKAGMGIAGINNTYFLGDKTFVKTTVAVTAQGSRGEEDVLLDGSKDEYRDEYDESVTNYALRTKVMLNHKFSAKSKLTLGYFNDQLFYDLNLGVFWDENNAYQTVLDKSGNTSMNRAFVNWKYKMSKDLTVTSGLHYTYFGLNGSQALEPRLGVKWNVTPRQSVNFGAGLHSKTETLSAYFAEEVDENGVSHKLNEDMGLTRSSHFVLGYNGQVSNNLKVGAEFYYQYLYDVPVAADSTSYALINSSEGYTVRDLVNEGTSSNYGVELTAERYFSDGYFFLTTVSLFDSKYTDLAGVTRNTAFNSQYVANVMGGKEFDFTKNNKVRKLTLSLKGSMAGGRWAAPLDLEESRSVGYTVYEDAPYSKQMSDYFKLDVQVKWAVDKKKTTRELTFEVQNVTNNQAVTQEYYNGFADQVEYVYQLSFFPAIYYKITF